MTFDPQLGGLTTIHTTAMTDLVGCRLPLQQAGMGGVTTVALAAAVSGAGGLGTLAAAGLPAAVLVDRLDELGAAVGEAPVAVNFLVPFLDRDALAVAAGRARVVECFYGEPDARLVAAIHAGGALAGWQVGSVAEARAAVGAGCDLVTAQGTEAGGHVRGDLPLLPLLDAVLDAVDVPVLAAGGLATARSVAAVVAAGAAGARVGTAFVVADESAAHPDYVAALLGASGDETVLTTAFGTGWPDAPHRVLRSALAAAEAAPDAPRDPTPPSVDTEGPVAAMALYAGQGVGAVVRRRPAAAIVADLVSRLSS